MAALPQISSWAWLPLLPCSRDTAVGNAQPLRARLKNGVCLLSPTGSLPEASPAEAASQDSALQPASQLASAAGKSRKRLKSRETNSQEHVPLPCPGGLQQRYWRDVLEALSRVPVLVAGVSPPTSASAFCSPAMGKAQSVVRAVSQGQAVFFISSGW